MNISPADLARQYQRSHRDWPFLDDVERQLNLPPRMLYALGSRETNLTNERGDGGHGWGVFQLDDRSHTIPAGYLDDVHAQAVDAAAHLAGNYQRFGNWLSALNAYNSGSPLTSHTAGKDYGPDVLARMTYLQQITEPFPAPTPLSMEDDMIATDPTTGDYWVLTGSDGGVATFNADGTPGGRYFGNLVDHPQYNAGHGKPLGDAVGIAWWCGAGNGPGYVIYTRDAAGAVHPFHFDQTTRPAAVQA